MLRENYDLEVVLPVCNHDHYRQRLIDFKKYGLLNIGKYKIKLVLLTDKEGFKNAECGWPSGCTVEVHKCPANEIAPKICSYYLNCLPKYIDSEVTRWYARMDDDSVTDVSGLIKNLDTWYDCEDSFYLATSLIPGIEDVATGNCHEEIDALKASEQNYLTFQNGDHEWESCYVSRPAMQKILSNKNSMRFIKERSFFGTGTGDKFFGKAAKIAKVYPLDCPFSTKDSIIENFSLSGGKYNHIHYLSRDINEDQYIAFLVSIDEKNAFDTFTNTKSDLYQKLVGQDFAFYNNEKFLGIITLSPVCRVANYQNPNEFLWKVSGENQLEFIRRDGTVSSCFENIKNIDYMAGQFLLNADTWHFLRRLYPKPWANPVDTLDRRLSDRHEDE